MPTTDPDRAAVKREFDEFRKNPAQVAKLANSAINDGYFIALEQARISGAVKPALFGHEYRRYYDMVFDEGAKSESHLHHIRAALFRIKAVAESGRQKRSVDRLFGQAEDRNIQNELRIFQAWLATLFESYLAMYCLIMGTRNAEQKIKEFANAFQNVLRAQRGEGEVTRTHTALLKDLTEL